MGVSFSKRFRNVRKPRNKYNNKEVIIDGIRFASQAEGRYYRHLTFLQKAGIIIRFECQTPFELIPAFRDGEGHKHRPTKYFADFVVYHDGYTEIVDVKGCKTREFMIKWKMLKWRYGQEKAYRFTIINAKDI